MTDIPALKKRLTEANSTIGRLTDNGEINRLVEEIITDITEAEYASVWMYDEALILRRERREEVKEISMETKEGLLYKCFATKEAGIYNYLTSEKGYVPHIDNPDAIRMKSKIMIPLIFQDEFIGIVTAYASVKKIKNFTNEDLKLFRAITPFVIDAIFAMRANLHRGERRERRAAGSGEDNGLRRRSTDTIENLDHIAAERESVQDTQAILDFTSNIVHDIRTPANGLLGFLEILEEQIEDKRLKEYLSHAKSSASLISDLTTSILDGISEKREPMNDALERVNTVKFFSEIAEIFSANMYKKEIHYNIFIDPTLPKEIELDTMRVKRVLMNLIGNASKFTPEHGAIEFSARYKQKEKKLHLFVKDNGIGIAKEKQEDIFKAFQQAEENTKALFGGTGLGLSICAAYVKEMGGKLLVDSELDKGSVFYFDIPLDIKEEMPMFKPVGVHTVYLTMLLSKKNVFVANHIARYLVKTGMKPEKIKAVTSLGQIPENTTHLVAFENMLEEALFSFVEKQKLKLMVVEEQFLSLKSDRLRGAKLISQYSYFGEALYTFICARKVPRVLIVEDDKISALLLTTMFEEEYCDVATAENGEEGLKILQRALEEKRPYNLVYTDHNMPLLSGSEMLARYRRMEQEASVARPVVTVSISGEPEKDDAGFPFDFFAAKPFRKQEIITIFLNTIKTNKGVTDAKT